MTEPRHNNFWLLLEVLAKRRGLILSLTILATLVSVGIASILPEWYKAEALIMPPKEDKVPMISLGGLSEGAAGFDLATISTSADVFVQILKSRTITDRIIDKFDLMKRYDAENYVEAFETLMDNSEIVKTTEGLLFVAVSDKEAKVAADLANAFVDELDRAISVRRAVKVVNPYLSIGDGVGDERPRSIRPRVDGEMNVLGE